MRASLYCCDRGGDFGEGVRGAVFPNAGGREAAGSCLGASKQGKERQPGHLLPGEGRSSSAVVSLQGAREWKSC